MSLDALRYEFLDFDEWALRRLSDDLRRLSDDELQGIIYGADTVARAAIAERDRRKGGE